MNVSSSQCMTADSRLRMWNAIFLARNSVVTFEKSVAVVTSSHSNVTSSKFVYLTGYLPTEDSFMRPCLLWKSSMYGVMPALSFHLNSFKLPLWCLHKLFLRSSINDVLMHTFVTIISTKILYPQSWNKLVFL